MVKCFQFCFNFAFNFNLRRCNLEWRGYDYLRLDGGTSGEVGRCSLNL